jgi:hypothetical protein
LLYRQSVGISNTILITFCSFSMSRKSVVSTGVTLIHGFILALVVVTAIVGFTINRTITLVLAAFCYVEDGTILMSNFMLSEL